MAKLRIYLRLTWLFVISLFVPTATLQSRVDALLAELRELGASGAGSGQG